MKPIPLIDQDIFPPFAGFTNSGLRFLRQLKKNNNREWFGEHKAEYEEHLKLPMQSLLAALKSQMAAVSPEIEINPRRSIFRIYRDTRFSKDKTPYKTHIAAVFGLKGHWEESAGFYVHVEPGSVYAGGGIYMPNSDQLKKIRGAIAARSKEFLSIVESVGFRKRFKKLEGERLTRVPKGYPPEHPMAEWLKYKQFYCGVEWNEKECLSERFPEKLTSLYKELLPLVRFLNGALGS